MPRFYDKRPVACPNCGVRRMLNVSVVDKAEPSPARWEMWWAVILHDGRRIPRFCPACQPALDEAPQEVPAF